MLIDISSLIVALLQKSSSWCICHLQCTWLLLAIGEDRSNFHVASIWSRQLLVLLTYVSWTLETNALGLLHSTVNNNLLFYLLVSSKRLENKSPEMFCCCTYIPWHLVDYLTCDFKKHQGTGLLLTSVNRWRTSLRWPERRAPGALRKG